MWPVVVTAPGSTCFSAPQMPGYWVWAKMIESLGAVGYDSNNMFMAAYDWRLSFRDSQRRDFYLTKLKTTIELARLSNRGRKVVLLAHSMGSTKLLYFLQCSFPFSDSPLSCIAVVVASLSRYYSLSSFTIACLSCRNATTLSFAASV